MKKKRVHLKFKIRNWLQKHLPASLWKYLSWRPKSKWRLRLYKITKTLLLSFLVFLLLDLCFPIKTTIEYAPVINAQNETPLYAFLTQDEQWRMFTRLDEITPELKKAIVFKEDRFFYWHLGINPVAIGRAIFNNLLRGKRTSGASTISMQVARLLEPKARNYGNKCIEMFRAMQLELHYSKAEILQMYLNMVPYGSNIQGVKAASLLYFEKSPDQLSLAEITALSIIPNRPNSLVIGKDNAKIMVERNKWLQTFRRKRLFPDATITDALEEHLMAQRQSVPKLAPQLAWRMRKLFPGRLEINTGIDIKMQQKIELLTTNYSKNLKQQNINNAAVIVLDNKTMQALAYLGSPDFLDLNHHGQVDGVKAIRSPGSTLKPFLYGIGFDKGFINPKTIISDVPVAFKDYAPENYDLNYRGNVSIEEALRQSLNIPSVKVLNTIGVPNFVNHLHDAGFSSIWSNRKKMGLSLILGGCGVSLEELATLYAAFANEGNYRPAAWTTGKKAKNDLDTAIRILSPEAAFMVTQVLQELQRPDLPSGAAAAVNVPHIAWKTGTSYGRRDAWSIGYNKKYTIAVWLGNFSGQGAAALNGAGTATPLLFQLFNAIDPNSMNNEIKAPKNLQQRLVCVESGRVPNEFCDAQIMDYFIPGISSNEICSHLKVYEIAPDGKFSYCTSCLPEQGFITKVYSNIEPELASFYNFRQIKFDAAPEHNPNCDRSFDGIAPRISSLNNGATYLITDKGKQELQLSCAAANDVKKVFWYMNDKFIGACGKNEKLLFLPEDTKIKISCTDDKGRNANINIKIRFI